MHKSVSGASQRLLGASRRRSFVASRVAPRAYARFAQDDIRRSPSRKKGRKESQTKRNTGFLIEQARTRGRRSVLHWGIGEGVARPPHGAGTRLRRGISAVVRADRRSPNERFHSAQASPSLVLATAATP